MQKRPVQRCTSIPVVFRNWIVFFLFICWAHASPVESSCAELYGGVAEHNIWNDTYQPRLPPPPGPDGDRAGHFSPILAKRLSSALQLIHHHGTTCISPVREETTLRARELGVIITDGFGGFAVHQICYLGLLSCYLKTCMPMTKTPECTAISISYGGCVLWGTHYSPVVSYY